MKLSISNESLIALYTIEHLTCQQIGEKYGVTRQTVAYRLKKLGVESSEGERVNLTCEFCGKAYWRHRKAYKTHGSSYCSMNCYALSRYNPNYTQWRQGQRLARAIVSLHYPLMPDHIVHHKDDDNSNNDLTNLAVFASQSDHMVYHHGKRKVLPQPIWDGALVPRYQT